MTNLTERDNTVHVFFYYTCKYAIILRYINHAFARTCASLLNGSQKQDGLPTKFGSERNSTKFSNSLHVVITHRR